MAVHEFKERIVLASAMVQCLLHGFYTLMFIGSAGFTVILKPAHAWTLFGLYVLIYLAVSAACVFDVIVVVIGATDEDDSNLGYPDHLLRIRLSLDMITSAFIQCLVIWRFLQLWRRRTYVASAAWFATCCMTAYGFVIAYWRESGTLDFLWGTIYRKLRFSFMAALGALIAGRTYWMSRKLKTIQGSHLRTRIYTWLGIFIDGGLLFTIFLLIDLELRIHIIRSLLPQMAGLASTCILYQETLGKAARDIGAAACDPRDEINATPVLDTIFSTPGVSLQARETLTRITNSEQDLTSIDLEYNNDSHINGGGRDSGLLGADLQGRRSRSVFSVNT